MELYNLLHDFLIIYGAALCWAYFWFHVLDASVALLINGLIVGFNDALKTYVYTIFVRGLLAMLLYYGLPIVWKMSI